MLPRRPDVRLIVRKTVTKLMMPIIVYRPADHPTRRWPSESSAARQSLTPCNRPLWEMDVVNGGVRVTRHWRRNAGRILYYYLTCIILIIILWWRFIIRSCWDGDHERSAKWRRDINILPFLQATCSLHKLLWCKIIFISLYSGDIRTILSETPYIHAHRTWTAITGSQRTGSVHSSPFRNPRCARSSVCGCVSSECNIIVSSVHRHTRATPVHLSREST